MLPKIYRSVGLMTKIIILLLVYVCIDLNKIYDYILMLNLISYPPSESKLL